MATPTTSSMRIATPTDADRVGALLAASYSTLLVSHYAKDLLAQALPLLTRANPKLLACGTFYVAESQQDGLVGCGGWTRKGVAHTLTERCRTDATARGIVKLHCSSTLAAEGFYRASGFETIEASELLISPNLRFPTMPMQLEIS